MGSIYRVVALVGLVTLVCRPSFAQQPPYIQVDVSDGFLTELEVDKDENIVGMYESSEARILVMATPADRRMVIGEDLKKGFIQGLTQSGEIAVNSTHRTQFQNLDAYRFDSTVMVPNGTLDAAIFLFVANGYAYQLQLLGTTQALTAETTQQMLRRVRLTKTDEHQVGVNGSPQAIDSWQTRSLARLVRYVILAVIGIWGYWRWRS